MLFFIRQLQYYCHLEVIACAWTQFELDMVKKDADLDSLIQAHRAYLRRLVDKALLRDNAKPARRGVRPFLFELGGRRWKGKWGWGRLC